jgi:ankyrin repeat protein
MSVTGAEVIPNWAKATNGCLLELDRMIGQGFVVDAMEPMLTYLPFDRNVLINPVIEAANMGYPRALNYLIEKGYSLSKQNSHGDTALGLACIYPGAAHTACVEVLLRHGADMYHLNTLGLFPITGAIMLNNFETVALFIRFDTNLLATDASGATVIEYAQTQLPKTATSRAILKILEEALIELDKKTAFAMGHHKRLGDISMVKALDPELLRMILALVPDR